eukprot:749204-Amphidinium_carterae.1
MKATKETVQTLHPPTDMQGSNILKIAHAHVQCGPVKRTYQQETFGTGRNQSAFHYAVAQIVELS